MQQLQHKQFTIQHTLSSLAIRYGYVPVGSGFTAPDSYRDGKNNSDKIRPWFER